MDDYPDEVTETTVRGVKTKHSELEEYSRKKYPKHIEGSPHNSENDYVKALLASNGRVTSAARMLGVSHAAVIKRIKNSEFLQMIQQSAIEERLDNAEEALDSLIEKENLGAIQFLLSTIGKDRGYVRREERSTTVHGGVVLIPGGMQMENWTEQALEYRKKQDVEKDKAMTKLLKRLEEDCSANDSVYDAEFKTATDRDITDDLEEAHITMSEDMLDEEELPTEEDMGEWLDTLDETPTPTKRKLPKPQLKKKTSGIHFSQEVNQGADGFKSNTFEEK